MPGSRPSRLARDCPSRPHRYGRRRAVRSRSAASFALSHFRTENRLPLFLEMLLALSHFRTENRLPLFLEMLLALSHFRTENRLPLFPEMLPIHSSIP